jgi:hypothetical protein
VLPETHVNREFLNQLASQLAIGKCAMCRRAILRILAVVKTNYETGEYESQTEAENAFRRLVKGEKACK